ncbi:pyridoxamine 5'-phosphate oxidase family protein [Halobacterium wangiae]|uniref:pyridoxamine 5'-phosphate oxidase family protein n=1 Tax=Halobacterium wangiae TaxID=2902623 RepID=UPI001E342B88|nr:pyridoxamine 5'-phosphate oxidase family protein [Halobacterium wangiae]
MSDLRSSDTTPGVEMTDAAVATFLENAGDGVLTLHTDAPYSFPVSVAYDTVGDRCLFQFLSTPGSAKRRHLAGGVGATFVAYEWTDPDDWCSVVVEGELVDVPDGDDTAVEVYAEQATPVGLAIFDALAADLTSRWSRLRPDAWSGRQSPI